MEMEYIILTLVRLGLALFSFFALPRCVLMIKSAWIENDHKKMRKGVIFLWGGILAGLMFLKLFGGVPWV